MMPREITWQVPAGAANDICLSQTPGAAGPLTLNGSTVTNGVALIGATMTNVAKYADGITSPAQRRIRITCAGADAGRTFTIKGHPAPLSSGDIWPPQSFTMAGSNAGTTDSVVDLQDITEIDVDAACAGAVTIGTSVNIAATPWQHPERELESVEFNIGFCVFLAAGSATYHIEHHFRRRRPELGFPLAPDLFLHSSLGTDQTASHDGNYILPMSGFRMVLTAGTGTLRFDWIQQGVIGSNAF